MNKRLLMILVAAAGLLLLAVIILLIVVQWQRPDDTTTNSNNLATGHTSTTETTTTNTTTDTNVTTDSTGVAVPIDDRTSITRLARNFTERYGSYSTDTNYENIELARSFMTTALAKQADAVIANDDQSNQEFFSVTSQVTGITITDFSDGATGATVAVTVRQTTVTGQNDPTFRNAEARLTLKKQDLTWLVDSFRWL